MLGLQRQAECRCRGATDGGNSEADGRVGIGACPEAQVDAFEVALVGVVAQGHVQLDLYPGIALAMPSGPAEQRLVGGVIPKRIGEGVVGQEIDSGGMKAVEERRVVGLEDSVGADPFRVGAPRPEQVHVIPASCGQRPRERGHGLEVQAIAVAEPGQWIRQEARRFVESHQKGE